MIRSRKVANPLALVVLELLLERPMHPYEMAATLRERNKENSIRLNYGSLYTVIRLLQRAGFIVAQETSRAGRRPERTIYALTPAGEAELRDWLADLLRTPVKEYLQFEAGLSLLAALPIDQVVALLEERVARLDAENAQQRATLDALSEAGLPRLLIVESDYVLALRQAEREWVAGLLAQIRDGSLAGLELWRSYHAQRSPVAPAPAAPSAEGELASGSASAPQAESPSEAPVAEGMG
ncbi:MAG TPA: helix-turn-helix transcriptional regulator [Chloroflexota bacterium]|nr:helix-turn-helix transcriptional regulator [Chloroflexota bacterium]